MIIVTKAMESKSKKQFHCGVRSDIPLQLFEDMCRLARRRQEGRREQRRENRLRIYLALSRKPVKELVFRGVLWASQVALVVKNPPTSAGDIRDANLIPGSGRCPGGGHKNPFPYSCLENSTDGRAWQATVHGVAMSQTQLKQLSMHMHGDADVRQLSQN